MARLNVNINDQTTADLHALTERRGGLMDEFGATSNEVHVTPSRDLITHEMDGTCPCGPTTEPVTRNGGSIGWVVTHHSLDGREKVSA